MPLSFSVGTFIEDLIADISKIWIVPSSKVLYSDVLIKPKAVRSYLNCISVITLGLFPLKRLPFNFPFSVSNIFIVCPPFSQAANKLPSGLKTKLVISKIL